MKHSTRFNLVSLVLLILLVGCAKETATKPASPTAAAPVQPAATLANLPDESSQPSPLVIQFSPNSGEEVGSSQVVELVFDQAMDQKSVEAAFSVRDGDNNTVAGKISWVNDSSLQYQADAGWSEASYYEIRLADTASSQNGQTLSREFTSQFKTISPLLVSQVFPAKGTQDVDTTTSITILFNRPVIALQTKEDQTNLVQPISISPEIKGKGNWVNSSIYSFQPDQPLSSGTRYTIWIEKGLAEMSADENLSLQQDFQWSFSTRKPAITSFQLDGQSIDITYPISGSNASLLPKLGIAFSQEMDKTATAKAVSITYANGAVVPVRNEWSKDGKSLTITPLKMLNVDASYTLTLANTAKAKDGGGLMQGFSWDFHTVPAPYIVSTYPQNLTENSPDSFLKITFATPMRGKTIQDRVIISPQPEEKIQMYYYEGSYEAFFYGLQPSTDYVVKILPGMQDMFGNQINTAQEIRFSTAQYNPSAYLNMPYGSIYRGKAEQEFFVNSTNVTTIDFKIYKVPADQLVGYQDMDRLDLSMLNLAADFEYHPESTLNQNVLEKVKIQTPDGKKLAAGAYLLIMDSDEVSKYTNQEYLDYRYFMITDIFLAFKNGDTDALVWAVDAQDGTPVPDLGLDLYSFDKNSKATKITSGTTDKNGLLHLEYSVNYSTVYVTSSGNSPFTFAQTGWSQQVWLEDFGYNSIYSSNEFKTTAYLYTDRPLYRPGQPVYFKGIMRQDNDLEYLIPAQKEVEVVINSYDREVFREVYPLSASSTFSGQFTLDAEASLGNYSLSVLKPDDSDQYYDSISFNVAEYRKPDFKVNLSTDKSDLLTGGSFLASLQADYYAGGSLSNAQVDWTVSASPYIYTPPETYSSFSFSSAALDDDWYSYRSEYESPRQLAQGSTTTDPTGHAEITVPAKVADSKSSQVLTLETTITGLSGNPVSERINVNAHSSEVITGIRPLQYVAKAGEEQTFETVVLDWKSQPVANQLVNVVISQRQWYSVQKEDAQRVLQWETTVKDIPVARFSAKTDEKGLARGSFIPAEGGVYRAVVSSYDRGGHISQSAAYMWVAGENYVSWRQSNDRTFQLVADKTLYKPGETAEVLIASPFQGEAYALVTVERARIRKQEVVKLTSNSTIYKLPISSDMGPAVYLSVTVVKGMDETNPYPAYKTSIVRINVSTESRLIAVEVTPDKKTASPGETIELTVKTKDSTGQPIPAEISLALVDLSTLALSDPNTQPIADYFYSLRGLSIKTVLAHDMNIDEYNVKLNIMAAGVKEGGGGDDKGGDIPGVMGVRKNFPDTAYWNATVQTDEEGQATVKVTLPGNLTTWRVDARAVTNDTLVGQTTADILSNKPLMVQPVTPRFFISGDKSQITALITNNTKTDLPVSTTLDATGLVLDGAKEQKVDVKAGQQALVSWKVSIPVDSSRVDLTISVKGGTYSDASLAPLGTLDNQGLPVYRYQVPETVGTSGIMREAGTRTEGVRLPDQAGQIDGNIRIELEPSLVNGLEKGVTFLEDYPYDSMDITISEFLSAIALDRALATEGKQTSDAQQKVDDLINKSLQRIYASQNSDGGWGWWSDNTSDPITSAYVMLGLAKLKENDQQVNKDVVSLGSDYLILQIQSLHEGLSIPLQSRLNRQAFLLYALTINQYTKSNFTDDLYENRTNLSYYAQAMLLRVLDLQNHKDPRIQTLLADLVSSAALSSSGTSWEEKNHDWWNWNTDTRTTAIVLQTLIELDDQNPLIANAVRWLMNHRTESCWRTTQETAWSLMALSDWMVMSKEMEANYAYSVTMNDETLLDGQVTSENITEAQSIKVELNKLLQDQTNRLSFSRGSGNGSLYYTTYMTANLPVADIEPLDQGFSVSRKYFNPSDLKTEVTSSKTGDLLLAELTIVVPQSLHYVTIEDPLPAGMEAVDTSLKTSPQGILEDLYDWKSFGQEGWGWWYFTHSEKRDEKVVLFANWLPAGTYVYHYYVRSTTPGLYQVIPPHGQEVYFPDVYGRGAGSEFTIE